jgi:tRNA modification GTPase
VLVVIDRTQPLADEDEELLRQAKGRPTIVVENKSDLPSAWGEAHLVRPSQAKSDEPSPGERDSPRRIATSALTGEGIPALRAAILEYVAGDVTIQQESGFLTSLRHQKLVNDARASLDAASDAVAARVPHEMLLLDLYAALRSLDEITGATTTDDILNLIFSSFCIGK